MKRNVNKKSPLLKQIEASTKEAIDALILARQFEINMAAEKLKSKPKKKGRF